MSSLDSSLENLITVARVLIEREELRRGKKKKVPKKNSNKGRKKGDERRKSKKLLSERYPDVEVREDTILPGKLPKCPCSGTDMKESGLFDVTEKLEVIPRRYYIQRNKRPKYNF